MNNKPVVINASSKQQQERMRRMTYLKGRSRMKAFIPRAIPKLRRVIWGARLSVSTDDFKSDIQGGKAIDVLRLKSKILLEENPP